MLTQKASRYAKVKQVSFEDGVDEGGVSVRVRVRVRGRVRPGIWAASGVPHAAYLQYRASLGLSLCRMPLNIKRHHALKAQRRLRGNDREV